MEHIENVGFVGLKLLITKLLIIKLLIYYNTWVDNTVELPDIVNLYLECSNPGI